MKKENFEGRNILFYCGVFLLILLFSVCRDRRINTKNESNGTGPNIWEIIDSIPDLEVKKAEFEMFLQQPLNHDNPDGDKFKQRIFLSHVDVQKPVVLITEGYGIGHNYINELQRHINGNQIRAEHRFFGESKPGTLSWEYLTLKQVSADLHRIAKTFKRIYKGKWISAGWSKGGQTALVYRYYYPDDVWATVAYDAPLNFSSEDPRIDRFFETVGSEFCRERLMNFQITALKNKQRLLPLFKTHVQQKGYQYSIGLEKAFEYIVLEYPFSFWQYHKIECGKIPKQGASADDLFNHLKNVVSLSAYSDMALDSPSMYQFSTELGYYGYVTDHVKEYLSSKEYKNTVFAPQEADLTFKTELMQAVNQWLKSEGNRIVYIYGELDPWSAPAVKLSGKADAVKMVLKGGNHFTFIDSFPEKEKEFILLKLERWMGESVIR
jgi:hypothetical protein